MNERSCKRCRRKFQFTTSEVVNGVCVFRDARGTIQGALWRDAQLCGGCLRQGREQEKEAQPLPTPFDAIETRFHRDDVLVAIVWTIDDEPRIAFAKVEELREPLRRTVRRVMAADLDDAERTARACGLIPVNAKRFFKPERMD